MEVIETKKYRIYRIATPRNYAGYINKVFPTLADARRFMTEQFETDFKMASIDRVAHVTDDTYRIEARNHKGKRVRYEAWIEEYQEPPVDLPLTTEQINEIAILNTAWETAYRIDKDFKDEFDLPSASRTLCDCLLEQLGNKSLTRFAVVERLMELDEIQRKAIEALETFNRSNA